MIKITMVIVFYFFVIFPYILTSTLKEDITIGFMGDIMLGRLVNDTIIKKGYEYPWGNMLETIKKNDINIVNLETTLTTSTQINPKVFNFKSKPNHVAVLQKAHIHIVNIANNHILDFRQAGLLETIQTLDNAQILHVGSGKNMSEAKKPIIIEKHGLKIGIIGFTDNEPTWAAKKNRVGTNYFTITDIEKVKKDTQEVRKLVDIVIATIHWGPNMRSEPNSDFINFAHQMIDSGIDIIHGHSAHVTQGIEIYKKKIIMYDTGDFIDDYAVDSILRNDLSFLFQIILKNKKIKKINLFPIKISNMQVNAAEGIDRQLIIATMIQRCKKFETNIKTSKQGLYIELR